MLESYIRHSGREWIVSGYLTHVSYGIFVKRICDEPLCEELPCECIYAEMGGGSGVPSGFVQELSKEKGRNEALLSLEKELLKRMYGQGNGIFLLPQACPGAAQPLSDG